MREEDRKKLVDLIAQRVMAAMREQMNHAGDVGHVDAAKIHPPAGVCTGDYSKFKEQKAEQTANETQIVALSGIITASQLQAAMDANPDGVAVIARDARLTPLANDLVRQEPGKVRRVDQVVNGGNSSNQQPGRWMYWIDGKNAAAQVVVSKRRSVLQAMSSANHDTSVGQAVQELADAIKAKQVTGGILFVHNAAKAACFANRCSVIRAAVATCGESVEQAVKELGANVLIIEYPHHGPRAMEVMVDRMMEQAPQVDASISRQLADLHRHG